MRTYHNIITPQCWLLPALAAFLAPAARGQSTFTGAFTLAGQTTGITPGTITLVVDRGQASFKCMLFSYVPTASIQAWLAIGHRKFPIDLGTGVEGSWPLCEFSPPAPGQPPGSQGVDPGFGIPATFQGTKFTGTFTAPPDLEPLLAVRGGTAYLQVQGAINSLQNPLLAANLRSVTKPPPPATPAQKQRR